MDVAVVAFVEVRQGVNDRAWFLGGRRIVEVDQRVAVDGLFKTGKSRRISSQDLPSANSIDLLKRLLEPAQDGPSNRAFHEALPGLFGIHADRKVEGKRRHHA